MRFVSMLALLATASPRVDARQNRVARYDSDLAHLLDCRYPEILYECLASRDRSVGQPAENACYVAASCAPLKRAEQTSDGKLWEDEESGEGLHQRQRRQQTESQDSASQEPETTDNASAFSADPVATTEELASSSAEPESTTIQESTAASTSTEATVLSSTEPSSQPSSTLPSSTLSSSTSSTETETTTSVGASCYSTTIESTTSACSPGLLCATEDTHGYTICMEMQNEIGLAGKIIGSCFGAAIAVCVGTLGVLIYQDKRKQREIAELMEARIRRKERR
ncbi:uncharacterized protein NECHADRAFT_88913 [Fusarium vanettenii 77-13-4]|uniref:Extracellular membrane protein CFEM domain-containing protein n=1 Tax=Fusarium vanettenii (strain ATCC MYA-4622 / CBS 123669 / FGSC 9596 / NRRL 45880 / 77-13-4) TaxID=660122 RepID=C7ZAR6_FUSV7|nr:uncharacterized protein NECHADRAFT_88913 [Fusarium vanettenii 77-13-4]EEU38905.1 hypothetical protein NECHADRAFT_88913 [Fusarium vanettenii 77-13-4]